LILDTDHDSFYSFSKSTADGVLTVTFTIDADVEQQMKVSFAINDFPYSLTTTDLAITTELSIPTDKALNVGPTGDFLTFLTSSSKFSSTTRTLNFLKSEGTSSMGLFEYAKNAIIDLEDSIKVKVITDDKTDVSITAYFAINLESQGSQIDWNINLGFEGLTHSSSSSGDDTGSDSGDTGSSSDSGNTGETGDIQDTTDTGNSARSIEISLISFIFGLILIVVV